jgi:hypothetical protein
MKWCVFLFIATFVGLSFLISGCGERSTRSVYYFGFINKTGHDLSGVCAYYDSRLVAEPGILGISAESTEGSISLPIPSVAEVRWSDNGQTHAVKVSLKGVISKGITNDFIMYFIINKDSTVLAKVVNYSDIAARLALTEDLSPKDEYMFGYVNKTGHDVQGAMTYYGDQKVGDGGNLTTTAKLGYSKHLTLRIPSTAELRWSENGVSHAVKVKLDGVVPSGFVKGTIYFVIKDDDSIEIKTVSWGNQKANFDFVK